MNIKAKITWLDWLNRILAPMSLRGDRRSTKQSQRLLHSLRSLAMTVLAGARFNMPSSKRRLS